MGTIKEGNVCKAGKELASSKTEGPAMSKKGALRCLSVRNPWAWTICLGVNTAENRVWSTDHRGTIAIHTGVSRSEVNRIKREDRTGEFLPELFQFGMIIGLADVDDVVEFGPSLEHNPWATGPYCWLMSNGRFLETPIPLKGRLNLFYLADDVAEQVLSQPTYQLDVNEPRIKGCVEAIRPEIDPGERYLHLAQYHLQQGQLDQADEACDVGFWRRSRSGRG